MSVEFIGYISHADQSEIRPAKGDALDQDHLLRTAQAHEAAGFDRVLVAHHSSNPDGILLAAHVAAVAPFTEVVVYEAGQTGCPLLIGME